MSKKNKDQVSSETNQSGEGKKVFESTYQADKLRELIKQGKNAREIMDTLDIKSKQVMKQHCLKLIQEDKVYYEIPGLYEKGTRNIKATPKGEIKIGPSVLKSQGADVSAGDEFYLTVDGDNIILSRVKKEKSSDDEPEEVNPLADFDIPE